MSAAPGSRRPTHLPLLSLKRTLDSGAYLTIPTRIDVIVEEARLEISREVSLDTILLGRIYKQVREPARWANLIVKSPHSSGPRNEGRIGVSSRQHHHVTICVDLSRFIESLTAEERFELIDNNPFVKIVPELTVEERAEFRRASESVRSVYLEIGGRKSGEVLDRLLSAASK